MVRGDSETLLLFRPLSLLSILIIHYFEKKVNEDLITNYYNLVTIEMYPICERGGAVPTQYS